MVTQPRFVNYNTGMPQALQDAYGGTASSSTFLRGDGVWAAAAGGGGTVTTLTNTDGLLIITNPTTTPNIAVAGTSGGIPYFDTANSWASSGQLTNNQIMIGKGVGSAPTTITTGAGVITAIASGVDTAGGLATHNAVTWWYNVKDYASIAAAYAACAATGGTLYFPYGSYSGSPLTISSPNIWIRGDGDGTVLNFGLSFTADNCGFSDIRITNGTSHGVSVTNTQIECSDFSIVSCSGNGINCNGDNGFVIGGVRASNFFIYNCTGAGISLVNCHVAVISNGVLLTNAQASFAQVYISGSAAAGHTFTNMQISGSGNLILHSLYITGSGANKFTNCYFDNDSFGAVLVSGNDNRFTNCWWSTGGGGTTFSGMTVQGGVGNSFTNCDFMGCGAHGLEIAGGTYTSITGCTAANNSGTAGVGACHGIVVDTGVSYVTIVGCTCTNAVGAGLGFSGQQGYGIVIAGSNNFYVVQACNTQGNHTGGLLDSGGGGTKAVGNNI